MSEKVREEFEVWARCEHGYCAGAKADGTYYVTKINDMWQAWQASRAALVVELPQKRELSNLRNSYFDGKVYGFNDCIDYCAKSLDDSVVGYK